jgi:PAS domain S-box-containing protein
MVFIALPGPSNVFVSRGWREYTGLSSENTAGFGWQNAVHPEDTERSMEKWRVCSATGEPFEDEARFRRAADGEYRWFLVRAVALRDEHGNVLKWYGILTDIEDRKRAEALLTGEKRILEMVAKGDSLAQILDSLCRLVEEQASGVLASILLVDGNRLRHGGAPSLPKAYTDAIDGVIIGASVGSCGTAAYTGKQVLVKDIATDPLWADYREAAMSHSLRACWSTPIFSMQGTVIATFAMYYREPRSPSLRDQEIIEQITHLAGVAIERKQTQEALQRSEANLAEAQRLTKTGSWAYNPFSGRTGYWSEEMFRIFGLDPHEDPSSEKFWNRVHPEDVDRVRERVEREAHEKKEYVDEYRIVLPDGTVKHILDIGHPDFNHTGDVIEFVGTTVDITERKRAEHALRESEELKRRIIESSTDCINVLDLDGNLLFMSSGGQQLLEIDNIQSYLNNCWIDFWRPEDRPQILESLAAAKAGEIGRFQAFCPSAKGAPRWWDVITTSICNADGQPEQLLSVSRDITERKRAEEELHAAETRFRTYVDHATDVLFVHDEQGKIVDMNRQASKSLGYTREELIGAMPDLFDPNADTIAIERIRERLEAGELAAFESTNRRKDGTTFPVEVRVSPFLHGGHRFSLSVARDISERKRAEQELRRSESYLAEAQRLTRTGSLAWDPASAKTLHCSDEVFRMFGLDPQKGIPAIAELLERVYPEDREYVAALSRRGADDKAEHVVDYRLLLSDGILKYIHSIRHPVLNDAGEIAEFLGTLIDVTEQKRAEDELHAAETRFRISVDHLTDAIFIHDDQDNEGRIIDVNQRACDSLGYTREELIGMTAFDYDPSLDATFNLSIKERLARGEIFSFERVHRRKDGTEFPVEVRVRPFWHGDHRFGLGLVRDISERKRAEAERERLRQIEEDLARINRVSMMGELTASLAHEIKQPIAAAVSNAEACLQWLARDQPDLAEVREAATEMVKEARRTADIVSRTRSLFKKEEMKREIIDLNQVIRDTVFLIREEADRRSISVRIELDAELPRISGDPVQLQQVLINLVLNGLEAMNGTAAELVVRSQRHEEGRPMISVSDAGIGLPVGESDKIFDAFFTTKPQGTGMGLAISRSIVESHGGRLWAAPNPGQGTTFHFTVPSELAEGA